MLSECVGSFLTANHHKKSYFSAIDTFIFTGKLTRYIDNIPLKVTGIIVKNGLKSIN